MSKPITVAALRRETFRKQGNGHMLNNPNKNVCALRVAQVFKVDHLNRYLHTIQDVVYCIRKRFTVRSCASALGKSLRKQGLAACRDRLVKISKERRAVGFVVMVEGHVFCINHKGQVVVDTDPPLGTDTRPILRIYAVSNTRF